MIIISVVVLGGIGLISSVLLYIISKKFEIQEDPRIGLTLEALPSANCGGCGYPGCAGFAAACVKAESLDELLCPVGGKAVMDKVAEILGKKVTEVEARVAVVRCQGDCEARAKTNVYDGLKACAAVSKLYAGETACAYGCLAYGDCVRVCSFGAIYINESTGLAEVDEDKCTSCGACVKACPKNLIELRKKGPKSRMIYVGCMSKDKGGDAKKACARACIGCSKCEKACEFGAISLVANLAYIDFQKCCLCRKCVSACPTNAIMELNFLPEREATEAKAMAE
ncbi:MAG: Fe-S cluster domain-containing protein [Tannerellaceae bacterium]|jgi:RnfABCDGE-type electron transport complex B subunit|nr:Fe-S cluster domain-containing protein [Tannerellaceae bacterium]